METKFKLKNGAVILVAGFTGERKSTLLREWAAKSGFRNKVAYDPRREYSDDWSKFSDIDIFKKVLTPDPANEYMGLEQAYAVYEEADSSLSSYTDADIKNICTNIEHALSVLSFAFHSIQEMPLALIRNCHYVVLFNTVDTEDSLSGLKEMFIPFLKMERGVGNPLVINIRQLVGAEKGDSALLSVADLIKKINEVARDANKLKKPRRIDYPKGYEMENNLKNIDEDEPTDEPQQTEPAGEVKHKNKKTEKNPRGGGVYQYNDECECLKCREKRGEQPSSSSSDPGTVNMNIDVICTMQNNLLLAPLEESLGLQGKLVYNNEEQGLLNQVKPEGTVMKRSWGLYWTLNISMFIGKIFKVIIIWKRKKKEASVTHKQAA